MKALDVRGLVLAVLLLAIPSTSTAQQAIGVLVGIHRSIDYEMQRPADREPPRGAELRTIWIPVDGPGTASTPIEIPDLLLPRRAGFWRLGLISTCAETPHRNADFNVDGIEAAFGDRLWAVPVGERPTLHVPTRHRLGMPLWTGPCRSSNPSCFLDERQWIRWVWPEYVALDYGAEGSCGAHPGGSFEYSVQHIDNLGARLRIADVLGGTIQRRFERAFDAAVKEAPDCGVPAQFDRFSWHVVREPGGWKAEGFGETHRLCGGGIDFTAAINLSRITGRQDEKARWRRLTKQMPHLTDAHFSPDGRWIMATTGTEMLLFERAMPGGQPMHPLVRLPLSSSDTIVMVEWAAGRNVTRWAATIEQARQAGAVRPIVVQ